MRFWDSYEDLSKKLGFDPKPIMDMLDLIRGFPYL